MRPQFYDMRVNKVSVKQTVKHWAVSIATGMAFGYLLWVLVN